MTNIYQMVLDIVLSVGETLILFQMYRAFLNRNTRSNRFFYLGLTGYFIFQLITYILKWPMFSACLYYVIFTFLIACLFFTDTLAIKILVTYLFVVLHYSSKLICTTLFMRLEHTDMPPLPEELVQSPLTQIAAFIFFIVMIWLFIYFRNMRKHNKYTLYSAIIYIAPMGILFVVINQFYIRVAGGMAPFYLDAGAILLFTSFTLFYLIDKTEIIDEASQRNQIAARLLELQENYYKSAEKTQNEVASMRHDLKNHLQCIVSFLEMKQYQEALDYSKDIFATSEHLATTVNFGNNLISILLNNAKAQAAELKIIMQVNAVVPPILPIENVDLCIILGNLLDNAIEACNRMEKDRNRFIQVEILCKKSYLIINISNSYNGEYNMEDSQYLSVKKDQRFCGIGLSNVGTVIEKYDGVMKISNKDRVFTVTAMLSLGGILGRDTGRIAKEPCSFEKDLL